MKKTYTSAEVLRMKPEQRSLLVKSMSEEGKTVWSDKGKAPLLKNEDNDSEDEEDDKDKGLEEMEHKVNIKEMIGRIGAKKTRAIFIDTMLDCKEYIKDMGSEEDAIKALDGATSVEDMASIAEEYDINTEELKEEAFEDDDNDTDEENDDDADDDNETIEKSYSSAEVLLMKSIDRSKLVKKQITDKNGKITNKWVAPSTPVTGDHGHPSQEHAQAIAMYKDKKRFMSKDKAHAHVAKHIGKEYADYAHMHVSTGKTDTSGNAKAGKKSASFDNKFVAWFTGTSLYDTKHSTQGNHQLTEYQVGKTDGKWKDAVHASITKAIANGDITEEDVKTHSLEKKETKSTEAKEDGKKKAGRPSKSLAEKYPDATILGKEDAKKWMDDTYDFPEFSTYVELQMAISDYEDFVNGVDDKKPEKTRSIMGTREIAKSKEFKEEASKLLKSEIEKLGYSVAETKTSGNLPKVRKSFGNEVVAIATSDPIYGARVRNAIFKANIDSLGK